MKSTGKLERVQRQYFDRLVKLIGDGSLSDADVFLLENAAKCLAVMKQAENAMDSEGIIQVFQNGSRQVSPEWAVWRNAARDFEMYVKHFGLSPKARKDLDISEPESTKADPLTRLRKIG